MRIDGAQARLHEMLRVAGTDPARPTLRATWLVFREFVTEPVETTIDGVLVQGGTYSFYGPSGSSSTSFDNLSFVYEDGEHDQYEQLHCEFQFEPTPELRALGSFNKWWFAGEGTPATEYLDGMQARPEFDSVVDLAPREAKVEQEEL